MISFSAFAQNDPLYDHQLDQNKWQELRDGVEYQDGEAPKDWANQDGQRRNGSTSKSNSDGDGGSGRYDGEPNNVEYEEREQDSSYDFSPSPFQGLGVFGYILLGLFGVLIVVLIVYLFLNIEKKGAKVGDALPIEEVNPVDIPLTELERLLKEAIDNNDYRGAIRIYFIFIIRGLTQKNWIQWQKEKTNIHYLQEMSGHESFGDFSISVSYFELIWYGKREIDADKFKELEPRFKTFLDKLGIE